RPASLAAMPTEPNDEERSQLQQWAAAMPFAAHVGVVIDKANKATVTGHLDWAPERCTAGGIMHGGALMTLADSLGAVAAFLHLPEGATTATVSSNTVMMRPGGKGRVSGVATVVNAGRRFITVRVDLSDDAGKPISTTTQVQAVLS
ncbi:MAG TPA: PaaI family thioesterase, partial [Polyangiales bacterium]|nr:PaaI family thioesterase [Polyangiales bacterium]